MHDARYLVVIEYVLVRFYTQLGPQKVGTPREIPHPRNSEAFHPKSAVDGGSYAPQYGPCGRSCSGAPHWSRDVIIGLPHTLPTPAGRENCGNIFQLFLFGWSPPVHFLNDWCRRLSRRFFRWSENVSKSVQWPGYTSPSYLDSRLALLWWRFLPAKGPMIDSHMCL